MIKSVVKVMTGKEIVGFPDTSTCRVIVREMKILSQMMAINRLQGSSHNTQKYDGTTKSKGHWVEVQLATIEHTFTIGLDKSSSGTCVIISYPITVIVLGWMQHVLNCRTLPTVSVGKRKTRVILVQKKHLR